MCSTNTNFKSTAYIALHLIVFVLIKIEYKSMEESVNNPLQIELVKPWKFTFSFLEVCVCFTILGLSLFSAVLSWSPSVMLRLCTTTTPVALASLSSYSLPVKAVYKEAGYKTVSFFTHCTKPITCFVVWFSNSG